MYNFLSTMEVANDENVVNAGNVIDNTETYISRMYTPNLKVSNATRTFLDSIGVLGIINTNLDLGEDSLTYWLLNSGLKEQDYKVYMLFKSTIADMYSFTYAIDDNPDFLKYINKNDFNRVVNNIAYLIDYLSDSNTNASVLGDLYDISACLGVLKNQLDFIKEDESEDG